MAKNNKQKSKRHCLLDLKNNPNMLADMHPVKLQRLVPQLVRELLQGRIDLSIYGQYLLSSQEVMTSIVQYLYAEYVNAMADYNAYVYYYNQVCLQQETRLQGLYASKIKNAEARALVYNGMYNGFFQFFQTGNYNYILPVVTQNSQLAHQISSEDTNAIDYVKRQNRPPRNNDRRNNNHNNGGYNKKGGRNNHDFRAGSGGGTTVH